MGTFFTGEDLWNGLMPRRLYAILLRSVSNVVGV
jgi:hypothetical protein